MSLKLLQYVLLLERITVLVLMIKKEYACSPRPTLESILLITLSGGVGRGGITDDNKDAIVSQFDVIPH